MAVLIILLLNDSYNNSGVATFLLIVWKQRSGNSGTAALLAALLALLELV